MLARVLSASEEPGETQEVSNPLKLVAKKCNLKTRSALFDTHLGKVLLHVRHSKAALSACKWSRGFENGRASVAERPGSLDER